MKRFYFKLGKQIVTASVMLVTTSCLGQYDSVIFKILMQDYTGIFHDFHERLIMPDGLNGPVDFPVDS